MQILGDVPSTINKYVNIYESEMLQKFQTCFFCIHICIHIHCIPIVYPKYLQNLIYSFEHVVDVFFFELTKFLRRLNRCAVFINNSKWNVIFQGIATFTTLATTYQICVATYQKIMRNSRTDFDAIIQHLLSKNARAVVLFVDEDNVR